MEKSLNANVFAFLFIKVREAKTPVSLDINFLQMLKFYYVLSQLTL